MRTSSYYHRTSNATYGILGVVVNKKVIREKSAASSAQLLLVRVFMWTAVQSLRLWSLFRLLLFLIETNNFIAGTNSHCSSRRCSHLVVFFACWNFSAVWALSAMRKQSDAKNNKETGSTKKKAVRYSSAIHPSFNHARIVRLVVYL